ncbi:MAG TPA: outer membrane chaperone Skp [Rhodobacteraceae bacterium]|jgi:Skp family chaperone for outer membrane proteins|nr:outer membrane chaperone Skp [Paracoccaceae bacterium]
MADLGRLYRVLLLLVALTALPATGQTQDRKSGILTLNQEQLFISSLYGERIKEELEAEKNKLEVAVRQIESDLVAEEKALTEQRATMQAEQFRKLADAFDEKVQGIRKAQKVKIQNLGQRLDQERGRFFNLALPILGEIMRERGAAVVLDERTVFASSSSVDITDIAVARIDATLGDGTGQPVLPQKPQQ